MDHTEYPEKSRTNVNSMADGRTWTTDELLTMSPDQRLQVVKDNMVTDIDQIPPEMLAKAQADIRAHIAETDPTPPPDR
ncbi:MAG: hypothetical protein ISR43_01150 [Acidimicrobiia bacterium]|nr:hypothetical protein [Actinomycetota bacterium]MBL6925150.1 hypothetical protein [Acidimicrobiia bacterium]MBL6925819.1 hypothetical protein [Acidimicrobiia bacterium]